MPASNEPTHLQALRKAVLEQGFENRLNERDYLLNRYESHLRAVQACVPVEQLLVFDTSDGWEPLAHFLDQEIPTSEFPTAKDLL